MKEKHNIIWNSYCDPREECWHNTRSFYLEECNPDASAEEVDQYIYDLNNQFLDDEQANLGDIRYEDDIVLIANLGLWNGRRCGFKEMNTRYVSECLRSGYVNSISDIEYYVDKLGDFRADESHHDGTNHYLFRVWKPGLSEVQKENFLNKVYCGQVTRKDITRYTNRIGEDIAQVYGWKVRNMKGA